MRIVALVASIVLIPSLFAQRKLNSLRDRLDNSEKLLAEVNSTSKSAEGTAKAVEAQLKIA